MSSLADLPELIGFFSYSREDDQDSYGALSLLRDRIQHELRGQLGRSMKSFRLWQDKEAIAAGKVWESEIKGAVAQAVFFIPIITPTVVSSPYCRFELESFLAREAELGRDDLVFPILYIRVPALEDSARVEQDPILSLIARRQYVDWRDLRLRDVNSTEVKEAIEHFCVNICEALRRPWLSPDERKAQEEAGLRQAEAERQHQDAEAKRAAEEARQKAEAGRLGEEARQEAEAKRREEEARQKAEAEARARAAEEQRAREAEEQRRSAEAKRTVAKEAEAPFAEAAAPGKKEENTSQPAAPTPQPQPPALPPLWRSSRVILLASLLGVVALVAIGLWYVSLPRTPPRIVSNLPGPAASIPAAGVPLSPGQERALRPKDTFQECAKCPQMVVVPAGSFVMGSPVGERGHDSSEAPQHTVTIGREFAVAKFSLTFDEWDACVADKGCGGYEPDDQGWGRSRQPVINVSWNDAKAYVAWLSKTTGKTYRLLSEAEYEYATRAGTPTAHFWGADPGKNNANCNGCGSQWDGKQTAPVGSFAANQFGLYDMVGNTWEWTEDCYNGSYDGAPTDGSAWTAGDCRVHAVRGGSWYDSSANVRSAARVGYATDARSGLVGFRVARTLGD